MLSIKIAKKSDWINNFRQIGTDIKWFGKIPADSNNFFHIELKNSKNQKIVIGGFYLEIKARMSIECAVYIKPEFRRNGFASMIIKHLVLRYPKIRFRVSVYNSSSLSLFYSIHSLLSIEDNSNSRSIIFYS